jgi:ABC-type phosphate transport system substrate-binding protein
MNPRTFRRRSDSVSPGLAIVVIAVIAILLLAGLYVFTDVWDDGGDEGPNTIHISIAGSSTVWEFTVVAADLYEGKHQNVNVTAQKGGSGAGVHSVGIGEIDIGSSSSDLDAEDYAAYPDLDHDGEKDPGIELVPFQVAWDAVVVVVADGNPHGLVSLDQDVLAGIYSVNGDHTTPTVGAAADDGDWWHDVDGDGYVDWNEVPEGRTFNCVQGMDESDLLWDPDGAMPIHGFAAVDWTFALDAEGHSEFVYQDSDADGEYTDGTDWVIAGDAGSTGPFTNYAGEVATDGTGWYVFDDADASGDYTPGEATLALDAGAKATAGDVATDATLGKEGVKFYLFYDLDDDGAIDVFDRGQFCSGAVNVVPYDRIDTSGTEETFCKLAIDLDSQVDEWEGKGPGESIIQSVFSNQVMKTYLADDPAALGFMAWGLSSDLDVIPFSREGTPMVPERADIQNQEYDVVRALWYITAGEPEGAVKDYIDYCLAPENNHIICEAANYVTVHP